MLRPSAALNGAVILGVLFSSIGLFTHNLTLSIMAAALLVYVGWGFALRVEPPEPVRSPQAQARLEEGSIGRVLPQVEQVMPLVSVQWPASAVGWANPSSGAISGLSIRPLEVVPVRWGSYMLGPAVVMQSDLVAAWRFMESGPQIKAHIEPRTASMQGASGVREPIGLHGSHASVRLGEGTNLAAIRPYTAGDRLRRVNWRVTQRTGDLHVNQTFTERDTSIYVVLDTSEEIVGTQTIPTTSIDMEIRAAMSILRHYLSVGDRVAMVDLGGSFPPLKPGTGAGQARRAAMLAAQIQRDDTHRLRYRRLAGIVPGSLVFFCSPMIGKLAAEEARRVSGLGVQVIIVDCFPPLAVDGEPLAAGMHELAPDALRLVRMSRERRLAGLSRQGVPVVPWIGPSSLAGVLTALESTRSAARRSSR